MCFCCGAGGHTQHRHCPHLITECTAPQTPRCADSVTGNPRSDAAHACHPPMSNMRSASSITKYVTRRRLVIFPFEVASRSIMRPGVHTTTCTQDSRHRQQGHSQCQHMSQHPDDGEVCRVSKSGVCMHPTACQQLSQAAPRQSQARQAFQTKSISALIGRGDTQTPGPNQTIATYRCGPQLVVTLRFPHQV
jgi:hypothetical protein